jgi:hypothetical protein
MTFDSKAKAVAAGKKEYKRTGHPVEVFDPNRRQTVWESPGHQEHVEGTRRNPSITDLMDEPHYRGRTKHIVQKHSHLIAEGTKMFGNRQKGIEWAAEMLKRRSYDQESGVTDSQQVREAEYLREAAHFWRATGKELNPRPAMTQQLARAAATDAANRQMREAGRTKWNEDDYDLAAREFNRLWPEPGRRNPTAVNWYDAGYSHGEQERRGADTGIAIDPDITMGQQFEFMWGRAGEPTRSYGKKRTEFMRGFYDAWTHKDRSRIKRRRRNSITGKKLIAQWPDRYTSGGYGYIHGDTTAELLKAIKSKVEKDPQYLRFTISRTHGKDIGVGDVDPSAGTIKWNNWNARAEKVIKFRSPGKWAVMPFDESGVYGESLKPIKVFDTYQKADRWLMAYEGDLRLSGVPRKVNGRARGIGITATRKALRKFKRNGNGNPGEVTRGGNNPDRYVPRFIDPKDAGELVNLYHLARVPLSGTGKSGRYEQMLWASKEFSKAHPEISSTAAYKDLDGLLSNWFVDESPRRGRGRRRNPNPATMQDADQLYQQFHGRGPKQTTEVRTVISSRDNLAELGELAELDVHLMTDEKVRLQFPKSGRNVIMLCSSPDGRQLYFEGGSQYVDLSQLGMSGRDWVRDHMALGVLQVVTYRTEKGFDKFELIDYFHKLGEVTGQKPVLNYDTINHLLSVSGGQYEVRPEGIVN